MKTAHLATTLKAVLPLLLVACLIATSSVPALADGNRPKGRPDSPLKWLSGSVTSIDTANQSFTIEQKDQTEVSVATDNTTRYFVLQRHDNKGKRSGQGDSFGDMAVGDRVMVHLKVNGNIAKEVLIVKPPKIQRLQGTISGIGDSSFTISKSDNTTLTLNWDSSTTFVLKGSPCVQAGQSAFAIYNTHGMKAITVNIKLP